jgi:hypothetical protein
LSGEEEEGEEEEEEEEEDLVSPRPGGDFVVPGKNVKKITKLSETEICKKNIK